MTYQHDTFDGEYVTLEGDTVRAMPALVTHVTLDNHSDDAAALAFWRWVYFHFDNAED
jgi:hypothetical protein